MALIGFSDKSEDIWCVAGWVFRQVLDDIISHHPGDAEMADEFVRSKAYSGLNVDLLEPRLATKVNNALREVTTGILSGTIRSGIHDQPYGTAETVEQYRAALGELLKILPPT